MKVTEKNKRLWLDLGTDGRLCLCVSLCVHYVCVCIVRIVLLEWVRLISLLVTIKNMYNRTCILTRSAFCLIWGGKEEVKEYFCVFCYSLHSDKNNPHAKGAYFRIVYPDPCVLSVHQTYIWQCVFLRLENSWMLIKFQCLYLILLDDSRSVISSFKNATRTLITKRFKIFNF